MSHTERLKTIASNQGWVVAVYPISREELNLGTFLDLDYSNETEFSIKMKACLVLLGCMRDEHPNSEIADKAAQFLVDINSYARTIEE